MKVKELLKTKDNKIEKWPKVAIIILNWNGWKDTIECLESVFRNTYSNYQVIVVDNGSTDGSIEKIKAWTEGKQKVLTPESTHPLYNLSHPPIKKPIPYIYYTREEAERCGNFKLEEKITKEWQEQRKPNSKELNPTPSYLLIFIQTGENLGFAGGNNVAMKFVLKKSDYDYVWLLNNDTVIDKHALLEMVKLSENNGRIGMVGSKLLFYSTPNIIQSLGIVSSSKIKASGKHIGMLQADGPVFGREIEINYFMLGASLLAKNILLKEVGLLDDKYFMMAEEEDWCIRTLLAHYKLFCSGKSKIWHKGSHYAPTRSMVKSFCGKRSIRCLWSSFLISGYYSVRNKIYCMKKNFPKFFLGYCFIELPYRILRMIVGILIYDDYKLARIKLILKAVYDAITGNMGKTIDPVDWKRNLDKE